ncbi:MAG: hypothetical protein K8W52_46145 [Deltaproteobacteria bacterium]|nr:hypothetical protein [Deltaproteobacteria bacterium]
MGLLGDRVLEALLTAEPGKPFGDLLAMHGPVVPGEIDLLAERARDSSPRVRRNATVLLGLARSDDRETVLRVLAHETGDPAVFALAAGALRDGAAIARERPALVREALRDEDAKVAAAAVRLAFDVPEAGDALAATLADPRLVVRRAVVALAAERGPGSLESALRAMLEDPSARGEIALGELYAALVASDDPRTGEAVSRSLASATSSDRNQLATALRSARGTWVRPFLLGQVHVDGPWRWTALALLAAAPDAPIADLVAICRDHLAARLAAGVPERDLGAEEGVRACANFLVLLAGVALPDLRAILDFATRWTP